MRSELMRRPTKASTCWLDASIQCTSSASTSTAFLVAASASKVERRHRHGKQVWRRGRFLTECDVERVAAMSGEPKVQWLSTGRRIWCSPANGKPNSAAVPRACSIWNLSEAVAAAHSEQCRFADPRLASDHQRRAMSGCIV